MSSKPGSAARYSPGRYVTLLSLIFLIYKIIPSTRIVVRIKEGSAEKASGAPSLPASAQVPNQPAAVLGRLVTTFFTVNCSSACPAHTPSFPRIPYLFIHLFNTFIEYLS